MAKRIRVMVVDDSPVFLELISRGLQTDDGIEVIGKAVDPYDAAEKISELDPDVITCDIEMPKMNGIEFVKKLMPQVKIPVIMVSSLSNSVFDALSAGAVDFVVKPDTKSVRSFESFLSELVQKVKDAAGASVISRAVSSNTQIKSGKSFDKSRIIVVGSSTGGTEAIYSILSRLPLGMPPIVIVQHIPPLFSDMFAKRLDVQTHFNVSEAADGEYLEENKVVIAPGDKHITIKKIGDRYKINAFSGEKVNGHCPSADVLFHSAAKEAGDDAIGVILTGMGFDGAKGLLSMRRRGARTIGQDKDSCVVYGMPRVAFEVGAVEKQAAIENIPKLIYDML